MSSPLSCDDSIEAFPLATLLDAIHSKEPLNKQPFAGNVRLILVGETIVNGVWS